LGTLENTAAKLRIFIAIYALDAHTNTVEKRRTAQTEEVCAGRLKAGCSQDWLPREGRPKGLLRIAASRKRLLRSRAGHGKRWPAPRAGRKAYATEFFAGREDSDYASKMPR
jgi:hypothetical protein